jgi:predicted nucleic acid-binding protein
VLPWAVLPGIDYLARRHLGTRAAELFLTDVCDGVFTVEYGERGDIARSADLNRRYAALGLGLVDGVVASVAERLRAGAIATLDLRHFGALSIAGAPQLLPRDA